MPRRRWDGELEMDEHDEAAYQQWCELHQMDPVDVGSMVAYEEEYRDRYEEGDGYYAF